MTCECFDIGDSNTGEREQVATKRLSRYQSSEYQSAQRVDRMQLVGKRYSSSSSNSNSSGIGIGCSGSNNFC